MTPATTLNVGRYFDQATFDAEMKALFQPGPKYLGTTAAIPNPGDYYTIPHENHGRALVRQDDGKIKLISNICRHRQAIMLKGTGNLKEQAKSHAGGKVICPLHRWTYEPDGKLLGAPLFKKDPCLHLDNYSIQEWNGMLFEAGNGCEVGDHMFGLGPVRKHLSLEGMELGHVEMHECHYNWKTFIEIYLEDYHVGPFHPGLSSFVTVDDLRWEFAKEYSVQTVGVTDKFLKNPGSEAYEKWKRAVLENQGGVPEQGAIWLTYYPHIMMEWYPGVLTVSTVHPVSPTKTMNVVEFYYPEGTKDFSPEFIEAQKAAYMETAIEDDEIGERMDQGRRALMERGVSEQGPYQPELESGMRHFHEWYRNKMGGSL